MRGSSFPRFLYEGVYVADEGYGDREDANVSMFYGKSGALTKRHLPTK